MSSPELVAEWQELLSITKNLVLRLHARLESWERVEAYLVGAVDNLRVLTGSSFQPEQASLDLADENLPVDLDGVVDLAVYRARGGHD